MEIKQGSIVSYINPTSNRPGWFRVTRVTKTTVNLGSIFGNTIHHKSVPISQVKEDEANWYQQWTSSETYKSM